MGPAARPTPSCAMAAARARTQPGSGTQSASVKARRSPRDAATPRLRAAYELWTRSSSRRRTGYSATTARVASVDRLSTTISSSASPGQSCASNASMHVRMVAAPSRTGTTTVTVGGLGTDRLRGRRRPHAARQRLGAAAIAHERVEQVIAPLVLDGEHAGVAGGTKRGRERIEPVARSGERRLHVMALAQLAEQARGDGRPAHHLQVHVQRARAEQAACRRQVAAEEGEAARVDDGAHGGRASVERGQDVALAGDLGVPVILQAEADPLAPRARVRDRYGCAIEHAGHEVHTQLTREVERASEAILHHARPQPEETADAV